MSDDKRYDTLRIDPKKFKTDTDTDNVLAIRFKGSADEEDANGGVIDGTLNKLLNMKPEEYQATEPCEIPDGFLVPRDIPNMDIVWYHNGQYHTLIPRVGTASVARVQKDKDWIAEQTPHSDDYITAMTSPEAVKRGYPFLHWGESTFPGKENKQHLLDVAIQYVKGRK